MVIKNKELWNLLVKLHEEDQLRPILYFGHKSGAYGDEFIIAEDEVRDFNTSVDPKNGNSLVVEMVDLVINRAVKTIGTTRDGRHSVMCQILRGTVREVVCVYFSSHQSTRTISTKIISYYGGVLVVSH